jgi:3D (Asp-Asp-Asp) domain-containing protein
MVLEVNIHVISGGCVMERDVGNRWIAVLVLLFVVCLTCKFGVCAEEVTGSAPPSISLNKRSYSINLRGNNTRSLKAKVWNAESGEVIYRSSSSRVARVDEKGKITARSPGKATITARIRNTGVRATCQVVVTKYKKMRMRTTGYCNCRRCAGKWAGHATASGVMPRENHTIAVDPRLIPLGTVVEIDGRLYVAEDTGGAIKGKRIDVYYKSHRNASRHGVQFKMVKVYQ